ncbi:GPW/gp25 family protein [Robbsia sp. KACC 23696]|uniref:GPW/gp25 family protein n=1 Tax=Robbsia sp. KACC 23696 TaxID=3149231 RepID=UPI00325A812A
MAEIEKLSRGERGWQFPVEFKPEGPVMSQTDLLNVEQDLKHMMQVLPGERIMRPLFGCDWLSILFKNLTEDLQAEIKAIVADAVMRNEPRVVVEDIAVVQDAQDIHALHIGVVYRVAGHDVVKKMAMKVGV